MAPDEVNFSNKNGDGKLPFRDRFNWMDTAHCLAPCTSYSQEIENIYVSLPHPKNDN